MKPFLQQLADELFNTYGNGISDICLVFPNRRAGLYFRKYLSQRLDTPHWSPEVFAIEDFVALKSGLVIATQPALLINLYKLYAAQLAEKARPLKDFISWGSQLLSDFDEIDQHLADGTAVFGYLTEARAIEHWNPDGKPLTEFEKNYLGFYNSLAPLYAQFRAELLATGQAYLGLAFRRLIENLHAISFNEWQIVVFAGFNALTPVEEKLLSTLLNSGKAKIYWDADHYYLDNTDHEAGLFLRKYKASNLFGPINWISDFYKTEKRRINVAGIPKNIGQVKFAGQLLESLDKEQQGSTAIVLVDEGLLIPMLNSIPAGISDFNVTMGFPLKQTPAFSLIDSVFTLLINAQKYSTQHDGNNASRYYRDDILRVIRHPYLAGLNPALTSIVISESGEPERSFYNGADLLRILENAGKALAGVFGPVVSISNIGAVDILALSQRLIGLVKDTMDEKSAFSEGSASQRPDIGMEFLFGIAAIIHDLHILIGELPETPDIETLHALFTTLAATVRLPFKGEPLKGIQLMGVLETRTLDFDTLIMISVNEGLLPKGKKQDSFIPADIRREFGLPGYREHNAVFAYHFYRLLQRAKNTWLLYNTEADEMGNGEKSRFITQLLYELPLYNPDAVIEEKVVGPAPVASGQQDIVIPKDAAALLKLKDIAGKGFSPSLLSSYLTCSLQFYYSAILGLKEPDSVEETIDASMLGNVVHGVFYKTYQPYAGKEIDAAVVRSLIEPASGMVKDEFRGQFPGSDLDTGKNFIIVNVARNMVRSFLETEAERLSKENSVLKILYLEEKFSSHIGIVSARTGETLSVLIKGTADRIDLFGNRLRIIDYKTGSLENTELILGDPSLLSEMKKPRKMLQLLCYTWLYRQKHQDGADPLAGIVSLKTPRRYLQPARINNSETINKDVLMTFQKYLENLTTNIFDASIPFQQTDNQDDCKYCSFKSICNR